MKTSLSSTVKVAVVTAAACLGMSHIDCSPTRAGLRSDGNRARDSADQEHSEMALLSDRVRVLEESLPLLACGPELRALLHDVRELCNNKPPIAAAASAKGAARLSAECNEKDMKVALATAERDLETKSIGQKLLSLLRHEVIYPSTNGKIAVKREQRLQTLAHERLLPSTRFLLIAGGTDAAQRMEAVRERLTTYGIKDSETVMEGDKEVVAQRFEKPWNLKLHVPLNQLPLVDRPVAPAETRDLEQAVFLFRTDCM